MKQNNAFDVIVIGGGLAGLTTALHLSQNGVEVCLIEKKHYPRHKVCGEYVGNEVLPYLNSLQINPFQFGAKKVESFQITDKKGKNIETKLPLGGFGISRYTFDNVLYEAIKDKVHVVFETVVDVSCDNEKGVVQTQNKKTFQAPIVVGAFGKRSNLDTFLKRKFIQKKSPWLAVKNHFEYDFPEDTVALHNFHGGYCGLSKTETDVVNACYLTTFSSFKKWGNVADFQTNVLSENPYLNTFYKHAAPIFDKPLTISQISFDRKKPVENHIFMIGDSAGLIHPLCGNGMAMAIMSAKLFSDLYLKMKTDGMDRAQLENKYTTVWNNEFASRLKAGRYIQKALIHPFASKVGFAIGRAFPSTISKVIAKTHGKPHML